MSTKYIFFSGKGGVGKTSMACLTAVHYATRGKRTLIVTTDPASNLSDVFEQEIGHRITPIQGFQNLCAMEIDPDKAAEEYIERALKPMREVFEGDMLSVVQEQLSGPCTVEMASFEKFVDFMDESEYDVIVFDTAPTGHTIRLLELPVEWSRHIEESAAGSGQTCMGPVGMIMDNKRKFDEAMDKLRDPSQTDFIFVMQAETTSLKETERAMKELETIGLKTTGIIVNGLIPDEACGNAFVSQKARAQQKVLKKAKRRFSRLDFRTMELLDRELKGAEVFTQVADSLFGPEKSKMKIRPYVKSAPSAAQTRIETDAEVKNLLIPEQGKVKHIFFAGKGGVGKTTMACLAAVYNAQEGKRTLLITTDPAAHIGTVLDKVVKERPTRVMPNLFAAKIDPKRAFEEYKRTVLDDARGRFDEETLLGMEEELNSPCTEEMACFQKFISYAASDAYDTIVFDTAPTGHTLRLLALPMDWSKQLALMAGEEQRISDGDRLQKERFDKVIELMRDREKTTFCFVTLPEKTPIIEAWRASAELEQTGIPTQLVAVNLMVPEDATDSALFAHRRSMQIEYLDEIRQRFPNALLLAVPMKNKEVKGIGVLTDMIDELFDLEEAGRGASA
ncbi:MAG: TRC40/GET3/ArsA family transport-energizing ATPase [Bacillota bacterium]